MSEEKPIPKGWVIERLGDFVIYQKGKKPKNVSNEKTEKCSIPYVNIRAFEKNIIDEYTDGIGCIFCEDGDFLMVWDGARSGYIGKAIKGALGSTLVKITFPGIVLNYAYYYLLSKYLQINTKAKGTGIPHVDPDLLWNYLFPIAPLPEQHRIVAKIEELFSSLDKGIESLKKAQEQLKIYRQAVLKWAFEGRFTNPNVKEGELPEGWVWSNVHEASISMKNGIYRSSDIYSNDGVACLRMYNIEDGKVIWFDIKRMKLTKQEIEQYQLSEGDLLVNRVNSRDLVGKTAYINKYDEPIVYESKNIRLRLKKDISGQYMNYWFLLSANKYFTSNAQQTVGMASINQKQLGDFKFPLPPTLSEQNLIVQEIEKRLSVADKLEESIATAIQQAEALRQSILKKAFEGKLLSEAELEECRNDPNWEPASVLLERIASAKLSIKRAERHNKTSQDKNKPAKNRVKS